MPPYSPFPFLEKSFASNSTLIVHPVPIAVFESCERGKKSYVLRGEWCRYSCSCQTSSSDSQAQIVRLPEKHACRL